MSIDTILQQGAPPVIAILRGVTPTEAVAIGQALIDAGIRLIEVPLNSPEPFASVSALHDAFGGEALIGAGTVLDTGSVDLLAETGARLLVAPNCNPQVIARGIELGLEVMPGFLTPSEAFAAIGAGAQKLKLFPAFAQRSAYVKAVREVLPPDIGIWAVGGVDASNIGEWLAAGAQGVAIGGSIYRPGMSALEVGERAAGILAAFQE